MMTMLAAGILFMGPVDMFPVPPDSVLAVVGSGVWAMVDLDYDSGIR